MSTPDGPDGPAQLAGLLDALEANLLGGPRRYTRPELVERAGIEDDRARSLWRALGFATTTDGERQYTDADVEALENVRRLAQVGEIDDDLMQAITRIIGQTFARLASWQGQLVVELVARRPELLGNGEPEELVALLDRLLPLVDQLQEYVWRRQLAAYFSRVASNSGAGGGAVAPAAVGFVDMADFTALTRRSSEAELRELLTAFESLSTEVVGARGGQIVKTIGDEVFFVSDDPAAAAFVALELVEAADRDERLPQVRAGVACGEVVRRLGDVYGQTVNIASRLTSIARPGSVLVDENMAAALEGHDAFVLRSLRPTSVRGYRHLRPWLLRRAAA
jgi:adenylate cyclase